VSETVASARVSLTIDGRAVTAHPGELVIEAAERAGVFIPRFCYHPRMRPVGMCRMCLVEISGPRGFSLQPACFVRVADGQEVLTSSPKARKAQEGVLEYLLINHPLDCPVCDKGGECPLQDQDLSHGPGESRFIEEKRHWAKPIAISPLILLDRERCIQCARCIRFAEEVAGEALIDYFSRGDRIEVAVFPERPFSSYFSGNTAQICPVGALTTTSYRFKARPWDLEQVETTCTTCALGCRVAAQSSAGALVRYLGVDSDPINHSWLCDKGRFGFEATHAPSRLVEPLVAEAGEQRPASWARALRLVADELRAAGAGTDDPRIGVLGGARLTNEDAYAWAKLVKSVLRTDSVDAQLGDGVPAVHLLGLPRATIEDLLRARAVVLLSGDLREELPVLYLRLRAAVLSGAVSLVECGTLPSSLAAHASVHLPYRPGEAARLASALAGRATEVPGVDPASLAAARRLLEAPAGEAAGAGVVVVVGRASLAESGETLGAAASILRDALPAARFFSGLRRANVQGALDMGLAPGVLPGRVALGDGRDYYEAAWGALPAAEGRDATALLQAVAAGELSVLVLLGADPLADFPDRSLAREALSRARFVVSLGTHHDASNRAAAVVLPLAGDNERTGTTTSCEGRVTRLAQKVLPPGVAWPAWSVAAELARLLGADLGFENVESIGEEIASLVPTHRGLRPDLLGRPEWRDGVVVPLSSVPVAIGRSPRPIDAMATPGIVSVPEQGAPLSAGAAVPPGGEPLGRSAGIGRTAPSTLRAEAPPTPPAPARLDDSSHRLVVTRTLYDRGTLVGASRSLAQLAPEQVLRANPADLERLGVAPGGAVRLRSARGELVVPARPDEGVPSGVVALSANAVGPDPGELVDATALATDVRLERA